MLKENDLRFGQMSAKRSQESQSATARFSDGEIPIPDLESPRAFDEWRRSMGKLGHTREILSTAVANCGSPLASVRAAQLILNQPERAKILCADGLISNDPGVYQLAKVVLTAIDITEAYHDSSNPKFVADGVILRLKNILSEIQKTGGQSHVHQEALTRAHIIMVDACLLFEQFDIAKFHAAEAEGLGDALGIRTVVVSARYQRASIAFYNGEVADAQDLFMRVASDPSATAIQVERASIAIASTLLFQGDEDGLLDYLDHQDVSGSAFFRTLTLRERIAALPEEGDGNGLRTYAHAWQAVSKAFEHVPWKTKSHFQQAVQCLHPVLGKTQGFMNVAHDFLAAYIYWKMGDVIKAQHYVPSLEVLKTCPTAIRIFAYALRIELLAKSVQETSRDLLATLEIAVEAISGLPLHVIPQVAQKLQLTSPLALALIAQSPKAPYAIRAIGKDAILHLNDKAIIVYGAQGLRPTQAAAFILQAFGVDETVPLDGVGQRQGLNSSLHRHYFSRHLWYTPISSLELAWILTCCAATSDSSETQLWLKRAVHELESECGFVPRLQRQTLDPFLENADRVVRQLMKGLIEPTVAAKLLFGEGWHV
jgi:hypothetical protein